jgi:hypothetical protein
MDYARQNYVAQPGDSLAPTDFIRRIGPFDHWVINWGYRVIPQAPTPEAERPILNQWITGEKGMMAYRYAGQFVGVDPRAQTEDIGDDPIRASGYAVANLKRVAPNLVAWTTKPGEDYTDLAELHGEMLGMWSTYMGHVTNIIGGVNVDAKTADQTGPVYRVVPKARQKAALAFLAEQVFRTPEWLAPDDITSRLGPTPLVTRQANVVTSLLSAARLGRLVETEAMDAAEAYPVSEYLTDVRRALWGATTTVAPDANRRALQRVYIDRMGALLVPPAAPVAPPGGGGGGGGAPPGPVSPLLAAPNLLRSDLPALARGQLGAIRTEAQRLATSAPTVMARAHWQDVVDRVEAIFERRRGG